MINEKKKIYIYIYMNKSGKTDHLSTRVEHYLYNVTEQSYVDGQFYFSRQLFPDPVKL